MTRAIVPDAYDVRLARRAPEALRAFNEAGVLSAADVHVALRLAALGGEGDETVTLAAALAVRGPRLGHVYVDIATVRDTATVEGEELEPADLSALPWPEPGDWRARLAASPLVTRRRPAAARRHVALPRPLLARGGADRRRPGRVRAERRRASAPTVLAAGLGAAVRG